MVNADPMTALTNSTVIAVIVTYHPTEVTARLLGTLAQQCARVLVVDNGSAATELAQLRTAAQELDTASDIEFLELAENTGIAHAQNVGIQRAIELGATHVLLSDQDSAPAPDMVAQLLPSVADPQVGAAGPYIAENKPGGDELVYVSRKWGPRRASSTELATPEVTAAFLLASGCLIPVPVLQIVGLMNEGYFIDHVDLEWGLRARRAGYRLVVNTRAILHHSLGDSTVHLPGRPQPVHVHSPIRCYYLARNTIHLIRSGLLSRNWALGYVLWLGKYVAFNALLADQRSARSKYLVQGIADGVRGRFGPVGQAN
ncbi:MAG: glycosyltransferase family 2 protein [Trueperella sp.]|nr:glycosyltransferase family 2 protein [Trueperella sp.]